MQLGMLLDMALVLDAQEDLLAIYGKSSLFLFLEKGDLATVIKVMVTFRLNYQGWQDGGRGGAGAKYWSPEAWRVPGGLGLCSVPLSAIGPSCCLCLLTAPAPASQGAPGLQNPTPAFSPPPLEPSMATALCTKQPASCWR